MSSNPNNNADMSSKIMNSSMKILITRFALPVIIIIILARFSKWIGMAALLVYFLVLVYISRAKIYTIIGTRRYGLGRLDEAIKWFGRAYAANRGGIRTAVNYAYLLLKSGELQKPEEILQKALKEHPRDQDVPYLKSIMALVLWKKGELDQAVEMLGEVIQTYKTTTVYGSLGFMLIEKGDLDKALQFNLEALEFNPRDNIINDNLGQNYLLLGQYDKAREVYENLLAKSPAFPEPYYNYGLLMEKLGNREKALESMKKALDMKFSFLSTITREEIEAAINRLESAG
ncbi:MAG TPA: tetratricopeptide repeat protein [Clostridiales bacterium]|nr:tetratricopeptide repeat protein [Clostridiales bacterium]HPV01717.1 tetratricopeptide repeat protein [Clostridiales bacterium]